MTNYLELEKMISETVDEIVEVAHLSAQAFTPEEKGEVQRRIEQLNEKKALIRRMSAELDKGGKVGAI